MPEFTGTKDLRSYLAVIWRWKFLLLAFVIVVPAIAFVLEKSSTKIYRSSALVGVNQTTVDSSVLSQGGSFSTSNVTAIAQLVTTTPVAQVAAGLMRPPTTADQIVGEVSATGDDTTNFITIAAQDQSPARAAAIANAFAKAITLNQQQAAIAQLKSAIQGLKSQISHVSRQDVATRTQLQQQLSQLKAARFTQGSDAAVLQAATPSGTPTGLNTRRAVEIGLLIGLLLGFGAVALAENFDRRLRNPEDLEGMTELPLLASVAPSAFSARLETAPRDEEAFQMLRTSLMYFNVDRDIKSVLITSPGEKDGKTTVTCRLALAAAMAGLRVVLVDGDLRRAQATARFGIDSKTGLAGVLAGACSLDEAIVQGSLSAPTGTGQLSVLPAGHPPPNPSALMSSARMEQVLQELVSRSDLVIIDTPAALAVSDPVPLMRLASGVIVVARMNQSRRQAIRRLHRIITAAHGTPLGVVATGVTPGAGYEHYRAQPYAANDRNGHGRRTPFRRHEKPDKTASAEPVAPVNGGSEG